MNSLHGPKKMSSRFENPEHLCDIQRIDGVTGEPSGRDDNIISFFTKTSGEDAIDIATDVVPTIT